MFTKNVTQNYKAYLKGHFLKFNYLIKRLFVSIFFVSATLTSFSQNLIPNSSFEERKSKLSMKPLHWKRINTIDYYGRKYSALPKPRSGKSMIGMRIRKDHMEYITVKLKDTLISDKKYVLSFYVISAKRYYYVDNFGVYFSNYDIGHRFFILDYYTKLASLFHIYPLNLKPQTEIIKAGGFQNTNSWKKVEGFYVANGGESYLTIGYFLESDNLIESKKSNCSMCLTNYEAYYYIDKVSLYEFMPDTSNNKKITQVKDTTTEFSQFEASLHNTIVLKNIHFETDKAILTPKSYPELNSLVSFLKENMTLQIEISGHTDTIGNENYNKELSERRAMAVTEYLIANSISKERIKYCGYGSSKPILSNDTEEGRLQNRRVEMKIIGN